MVCAAAWSDPCHEPHSVTADVDPQVAAPGVLGVLFAVGVDDGDEHAARLMSVAPATTRSASLAGWLFLFICVSYSLVVAA